MDKPDEIRLHPTALTALCDYSVYLREVLKLRGPFDTDRLVGIAVHRAYAYDLRAKAGGAAYDDDEAASIASDAFDFEWSRASLRLDDEQKTAGDAVLRGGLKDQALGLAASVHRLVTPQVEVANADDVERQVRLLIEGTPIVLVGRLDVYEAPAARLRDLKTRARKPATEDLSSSIAMEFYALALEVSGRPVREVVLDVVTKTKRPGVWRLSAPAWTDHSALLYRIQVLADSFERGVFKPIDPGGPSSWVCSERCEYWDRCPFGRARRILVPAATLEAIA